MKQHGTKINNYGIGIFATQQTSDGTGMNLEGLLYSDQKSMRKPFSLMGGLYRKYAKFTGERGQEYWHKKQTADNGTAMLYHCQG